MLVGLSEHVRPEGETEAVNATVPLKPFTGPTVIVEVAVAPTTAEMLAGLPVTVKSVMEKVTAAEWEKLPLLPVTVTVYVPGDPEQDRVAVWDEPSVMLGGVRLQVSPAGETAEVRLTVPVKPLTGAIVMLEEPVWPVLTETLEGLAVIVKS